MTATLNNAAALLASYREAHAKLTRNLNTCTFISLTRREEDPFVVYADKLDRMQAKKDEALKAWNAAAATMSVDELVQVMSAT